MPSAAAPTSADIALFCCCARQLLLCPLLLLSALPLPALLLPVLLLPALPLLLQTGCLDTLTVAPP